MKRLLILGNAGLSHNSPPKQKRFRRLTFTLEASGAPCGIPLPRSANLCQRVLSPPTLEDAPSGRVLMDRLVSLWDARVMQARPLECRASARCLVLSPDQVGSVRLFREARCPPTFPARLSVSLPDPSRGIHRPDVACARPALECGDRRSRAGGAVLWARRLSARPAACLRPIPVPPASRHPPRLATRPRASPSVPSCSTGRSGA